MIFTFSYSCGYRKIFDDYVNIISEKYPDIAIDGRNYEPPALNMFLSRLIVSETQTFMFLSFYLFYVRHLFLNAGHFQITRYCLYSGFSEYVPLHRATATRLVDLVHWEQILRVHDALLLVQHMRSASHVIRSIWDLLERRASLE